MSHPREGIFVLRKSEGPWSSGTKVEIVEKGSLSTQVIVSRLGVPNSNFTTEWNNLVKLRNRTR